MENTTAVKKQKKITLLNKSVSFDWPFFLLVMLLLVIGLVMMYSASFAKGYFEYDDSAYYIKKQLIFAVIGIVAMIAASRVHYNIWRVAAFPLYIVSNVLLVAVRLIGQTSKGAGRWLEIGGIRFQPSEIAKLAIVLMLAFYISKNYNRMDKFKNGLLYPGIILGITCLLVVIQPHLSGTVIIGLTGLALMIVGGTKVRWLSVIGAVGGGGALLMIYKMGYMQDRIAAWIDPASDPLGKGFQTLQSLYAIGSGGLFGLGLGRSRQKYLYLPEPHNDCIFSIICEELGFIGAFIIIIIFALLIYRGFVIAWSAPDKFSSLITVGIMAQLSFQVLFNIAVATNTVPVTGISLPFFSYGGTSLMMLLGEMGIVLSVSRSARLNKM